MADFFAALKRRPSYRSASQKLTNSGFSTETVISGRSQNLLFAKVPDDGFADHVGGPLCQLQRECNLRRVFGQHSGFRDRDISILL